MTVERIKGANEAAASTGNPEVPVEMYPQSLNRAISYEVLMVRTYGTEGYWVVLAQVPLLKSQLEELKWRSGMSSTKDALQAAVDHYLHCSTNKGTEHAEHEETTLRETGEGEEKDWWWSPERRQRG
jgi:hypothetical protein